MLCSISEDSHCSSDSFRPRYQERGPVGAADYIRQFPSQPPSQPPEPVAYLTMDFELAKASDLFSQSIGGLQNRRTLSDIVIPNERDKVSRLHEQMALEQKRREPNYLPPILDRGEHVFQGLSFGADDVAKYQLGPQDHMTFTLPDGRPRFLTFRIGLAKEGSFYFIVLALAAEPRVSYHPMSPHERPPTSGYPPPVQSLPPRHYYEPLRRDPPPYQQPHDPSQPPPRHIMATSPHGPAVGSMGPPISYSTPSRQDQVPPPLYHPPRSEPHGSQQESRPTYQLPPILVPEERGLPGREHGRPQRDERSGRVDIGGLIEKPEGSGQPR